MRLNITESNVLACNSPVDCNLVFGLMFPWLTQIVDTNWKYRPPNLTRYLVGSNVFFGRCNISYIMGGL